VSFRPDGSDLRLYAARIRAPVLALLGAHRAPGPIAIVTGQLEPTVGTAALIGDWNAEKVVRVALVKRGSGYGATTSVFLTGLQNPFALVRAPDGSVLVGDWGTGLIYRIARHA
jgi:glucose/arabinose dehydrogenase